jgi:endonuclease/exonuclease/phosphatase family metal-dependent hydrolase
MKIATWNVERLKKKGNLGEVTAALKQLKADLVVLTETTSAIDLSNDYQHSLASDPPSSSEKVLYRPGENRATIWSKYPLSQIATYDSTTSICAGVQTPQGALYVYGTIVGILGNREESFLMDLKKQMADWERISQLGGICVVGDFNTTFSDAYYFTEEGRALISDCFAKLEIINLTSTIPKNIDHVAISKQFLKATETKTETWNCDKKLSDHVGVCVTVG